MKRANQIGKNIRFVAISQFMTMAFSFILLPFIINKTGNEPYGIYIIATAVTGYFGLADLGLVNAIIKYVAEFKGRGNDKELNNILSAAFTFYVAMGLITSFFLFLFSYYYNWFFKVNEANRGVAQTLFMMTAAFSLFIWPTKLFQGIVDGLQRSDLKAKVNIVVQILYVLLIFVFLEHGYGVVSIIFITQLLVLCNNMMLGIISFNQQKSLKISFPYFNKETYRSIFSFSLYMVLCAITIMMTHELGPLIIGKLVSVAAVAVYQPAYMFQKGFGTMVGAIIGSSLRAASAEMEGAKDFDKQRYHLLAGTRYIMMILIPMIIVSVAFMEPFMRYWMGEGFRDSVLIAQILVACWIFNGALEVGHGILFAKEKAKELFRIQLLDASVYIISSMFFIGYFGIVGIALAVVAAKVATSFPLMLRLILRTMNMSAVDYFRGSIMFNLLPALLTLLLASSSIVFLYPSNMFMTLTEMTSIYMLIAAYYFLVQMSDEDRRNIRAVIGF